MKTTKQHAAEIRATLKAEFGWNARQVSVRSDYFANGSSIRVVIKYWFVPIETVRTVAESHERIDRCEMSGEILSGCNRYVEVSYSDSARNILAIPHMEAIRDALSGLDPNGSNALKPIGTAPGFYVGLKDTHTATLWGESFIFQFYPGNDSGIRDAAVKVAVLLQGSEV